VKPGEVRTSEDEVAINEGRGTAEVDVSNTGDRPVQVGSHFHFFEVNRALSFDRAAAYGRRLDIPAGTAVRFEPGETKGVTLVDIGGKRRVIGFNGLVDGTVTEGADEAVERAKERGFSFGDDGGES
jgi:urease beta subunit